MKRSNLDIFRYRDYRSYLKERLIELKQADKKYSYRYINRKLDIVSPSHLKMVVDGKHHLSRGLARRIAALFAMDKSEEKYFLGLLDYAKAKTATEKAEAFRELGHQRRFRRFHQVSIDTFDIYNDPLLLVLREIIALPDFRESAGWLSKKLGRSVSAVKLSEAIETLIRFGLVRRKGNGGLEAIEKHIGTGDDFDVCALKAHYLGAFDRAAKSLDLPGTERHLGSLTMSISKDSYEKIIESYKEFLASVREVVDEDETPTDVYQFVMGLFPMTKTGR